MDSRVALMAGERRLDFTRIPVPQLKPGQALLRVEACGMCGTDAEQYSGDFARKGGFFRYPCVTGHEFIGRVEQLDEIGLTKWHIKEGDRVAVAPHLGCGACLQCAAGKRYLCANARIYGLTPADLEPLSGGFAQYVVLQENSVLHRVADHLSAEDAVLYNPLGTAYEWVRLAGTSLGDSILIIGPGQRGLSAVIAAKELGASKIIVAGRGRRPWKLELAQYLGATHVINTDTDDLATTVREITGGEGVDQAIDLSHRSTQPIVDAVKAVRREGTIVLAGFKGVDTVDGLDPDMIWMKGLTIRGVRGGMADWGKAQALATLAEGRYPVGALHTHTFGLDQLERAIHVLSGEEPDDRVMHITVKL